MRRLIKAIIPLPARIALKRLGYGLHDLIDPIKDPRIPPRRNTFIGGGDFATVGDSFRDTLIRHGLTDVMKVLDVGCGQGRMARPLIDILKWGRYTGFDIDRSGIEWCQEKYSDLHNFKFEHADVFNARYNKGGQVLAKDYKFPYDTDAFDMVFLTSVFTHMFGEDIENYLSEIARVLKPNGKVLITWFLWDNKDKPNPILDFYHPIDDISRTTLPQNPEAALAFERAWVEILYHDLNLKVESIELGGWREGVTDGSIQDLIIARKKDKFLEH